MKISIPRPSPDGGGNGGGGDVVGCGDDGSEDGVVMMEMCGVVMHMMMVMKVVAEVMEMY